MPIGVASSEARRRIALLDKTAGQWVARKSIGNKKISAKVAVSTIDLLANMEGSWCRSNDFVICMRQCYGETTHVELA